MKILNILSIIWVVVCLIFAIISLTVVPEQIKKDNSFIQNEIMPAIATVKEYKRKNFRLPTQIELDSLTNPKRVEIISNNEEIKNFEEIKDYIIPDTNAYVIAVWRGDWNEYYISWKDEYKTNNYNWKEGLKGLLLFVIIGFIPIVLLKTSQRIKKKH